MMDAWYLLTFTSLSKELGSAKSKKKLLWFILNMAYTKRS